MPLTKDFVAGEFLAAAQAFGLKNVMVLVGKLDESEFLVTMTHPNPTSIGDADRFLVSSWPYEFDDPEHVREIAIAKAAMFARAIPTIH